MSKKIIILICKLFFLGPLFSQTVSFAEFDAQVQKFADAVKPVLPFAAAQGLNWSSPYVGQLIGYPSHFGAGFFVTSAFVNSNEPAALGELLGFSIEDSMVENKQWFPNWVVAVRLGGIGDIPFDVGIKFGYQASGSVKWPPLNYASLTYGFALNYAFFIFEEQNPIIVLGIEYDRLEGAASGETSTVIEGLPRPAVGSAIPVHIAWESNTIKAQALVSMPLMATGLRFFGGIDLGYGMNKAGVKVGSDRYSPTFENMKNVSSMLFSGSVGLGLEIGVIHIDASFMLNFINFESGIGFGIRYQQ